MCNTYVTIIIVKLGHAIHITTYVHFFMNIKNEVYVLSVIKLSVLNEYEV